MKPSAHEVILLRTHYILAGKPLPRERFMVFRVQRAGLPDEYHEEFWSSDSLEPAKELCEALVTESLGAYVLDVTTGEKLFGLKAKGH